MRPRTVARRFGNWWTVAIALVSLTAIAYSQLSAADRSDPQPSPLFRQSLDNSVAKFDQQAGVTTSRTSAVRQRAGESAGGIGRSNSTSASNVRVVRLGEVGQSTLSTSAIPRKDLSATPTSAPSATKDALSGGENIATATPIPGLPFSDAGSTVGALDDYEEFCPWTEPSGPDVVYSYAPSVDQQVDISLCASLYDTRLFIYENAWTPGAPFACNDDICGDDGFKSGIGCLELIGGNTYYIVVDGWNGASGSYDLAMAESDPIDCAPCVWDGCSPLANAEGEACGDNPDVTNGGCNSSPEVYSSLSLGEIVCGTSSSDATFRDTDWWRTDLTDADSLTWCIVASFEFDALVIDITNYVPGEGCESPNLSVLANISNTPACDTIYITGPVAAGSYVLFISPPLGTEYACVDGPWEYQVILNPEEVIPPTVDDVFLSSAEICLIIDPDNPCLPPAPDPTVVTGPVRVRRGAPPYPPGNPSDEIPTEMVEMSLSGSSPLGIPIEVRLSPDQPSIGSILNPNIDGAGAFQGAPESFFDVFIEIEVEGMGLTLVNRDPIPVLSGPIVELPPFGTPYQTAPSQAPIPLFPKEGPPTNPPIGWICYVIHTPTEPMECVCIYELTCVSGPPDEVAQLGMCVGDMRAGSMCTCVGGTCSTSLTTSRGNVCMQWTWTGACEPSALPPIPGAAGGCSCNPAPTMPSSPTCPGETTCEGSSTCYSSTSCQGTTTCQGFYTCMAATCAAIETCRSVTCTAEATCAGSSATCSPNVTCAYYPTCAGTETCETQTCVGWSTCRGSQTCQGVPTCEPPPTYQGPACGEPTMMGNPSCHGSSTCEGFFTCMGATCAAIETCQSVTCTAEPTCWGSSSTCSPNPTCMYYPSCEGTQTCGTASTCIGAATCQGSSTCNGAPTCEQPTFTGPTCEPTSCNGVSCAGTQCPPTMACDPSCPPLGNCPTSIGTPSCPAGGICPTIVGAISCQGGNCVTVSGPSCDAICPTFQGWFTCNADACIPPTHPGRPTCDVIACPPTWFAQPSCSGDPSCFPTIAPWPSCQGIATCAIVICPPPTLPGTPTCAGAATCPATATCNPFGVTCAGVATCPPFASCGGASCPGVASCAGFNTCPGTNTCVGGHTCTGNPTCRQTVTCAGAVATCIGTPTCGITATCGGWPTCNGTATCNGVATCDVAATCNGSETCAGAASCSGAATCDGTPTCRFSATCDGWPTCQPPPDDVSDDLKLLLDSLRYGWVDLHFGPDTTEAFEYDDWHLGPLSPLLIWDELDPVAQGEFVLTTWLRPDIDSARVDTEYVRVLYEVGIDRYRDSNGDGHISVSDFVLLHFRSPVAYDSISAWYHVEAIGKSLPDSVKYIIKLLSAIPPEIPNCACDCLGDPQCDGITNVIDVVLCVNVAFKGALPILDPNAACPFETTDVDCSGFTNVIDVVRVVNVAFRGGNAATEFCDPCP